MLRIHLLQNPLIIIIYIMCMAKQVDQDTRVITLISSPSGTWNIERHGRPRPKYVVYTVGGYYRGPRNSRQTLIVNTNIHVFVLPLDQIGVPVTSTTTESESESTRPMPEKPPQTSESEKKRGGYVGSM